MSNVQQVLDDMFQFSIGEQVYFKVALHDSERKPKRFIILERVLQQCSGGIQFFYVLGGPTQGNFKVSEVEITKEEPSYKPMQRKEILDSYMMGTNVPKTIIDEFIAEGKL